MTTAPSGRLRVSVNPDACCSSGLCVETAPRIFDQDPQDGTVLLLQPIVDGELADAATLCAKLCPCDAIAVAQD
ncbi:MAG: ferredoxin [Jatrophihabitantaceae bacterium]